MEGVQWLKKLHSRYSDPGVHQPDEPWLLLSALCLGAGAPVQPKGRSLNAGQEVGQWDEATEQISALGDMF